MAGGSMVTGTKLFVGEHFSVLMISGIKKFYAIEGGGVYHDFPQNYFVSQYREASQTKSSVFMTNSSIENVHE